MRRIKFGFQWRLLIVVGPLLLAFRFPDHTEPASRRAASSPPVRTASAPNDEDDLLKEAQGYFEPLPKDMATADFPVQPDRVKLGRMLFFDPRISVDGTASCARCHLPSLYATDALPKSRGAHDKLLPRKAPTVLNAAIHFKQHWRGDFETVEEQAKCSLLGLSFANSEYAEAMARVRAIPAYMELFERVFPGETNPVTADNWGKAIGPRSATATRQRSSTMASSPTRY